MIIMILSGAGKASDNNPIVERVELMRTGDILKICNTG